MTSTNHMTTDTDDLRRLPVLFDDEIAHAIDQDIVETVADQHDVSVPHLHGALNAIDATYPDSIEEREHHIRWIAADAEKNAQRTVAVTDNVAVIDDEYAFRTVADRAGVTEPALYEPSLIAHEKQAEAVREDEYLIAPVVVRRL